MKRITLKEVRDLQLELLNRLDYFFRENEIKYFAFAGTLLGTVRHKGFIPWDNDIDLAVSRTDYEKMQKLLHSENSHEYFRFLCYENDSNYLWQHGRIVQKGTYMKTARGYNRLGLSIDIFPLDSQGNDIKKAREILHEIKICVYMRIMSYDKKYKGNYIYPKVTEQELERLKILFEQEKKDNEEYWVKRHIELAKFFEGEVNSRYYGCNSNDKYSVVCERAWFEKSLNMPFEEVSIPVPIGYKEILKQYYGDYMNLPEVSQRKGLTSMEIFID